MRKTDSTLRVSVMSKRPLLVEYPHVESCAQRACAGRFKRAEKRGKKCAEKRVEVEARRKRVPKKSRLDGESSLTQGGRRPYSGHCLGFAPWAGKRKGEGTLTTSTIAAGF